MRLIVLMISALVVVACGDGTQKKTFVPPNSGTNSGTNSSTPNNATTPVNVGATCGNGTLDPIETCDPAIATGAGACPSSCSSRACTTATLIGAAETCTAECIVEPVGCVDGDGCCTAGCTSDTDSDCSDGPAMCGNGVIEAGELCDGNCPTSCPAGPSACQPSLRTGAANTCDAQCLQTTITACQGGDGCCPNGCTNATDSDCTANCTPETCANIGATCGNPPDGCGGRLNCGTCATGDCTEAYVCSNVGDPCAVDDDCVAGPLAASCLTSEPNGYCSAACNDTRLCTSDSFCGNASTFQDGFCSAPCTSNADCRIEYECRELNSGQPATRTCLPIEDP